MLLFTCAVPRRLMERAQPSFRLDQSRGLSTEAPLLVPELGQLVVLCCGLTYQPAGRRISEVCVMCATGLISKKGGFPSTRGAGSTAGICSSKALYRPSNRTDRRRDVGEKPSARTLSVHVEVSTALPYGSGLFWKESFPQFYGFIY